MRFLEDIKIPTCLSMGICAVRAFIHSLITEEERYSRLYNSIFKERLECINSIENWLLIVSILILIPALVYNIKKKRVKELLFATHANNFGDSLDFLRLLF